MPEPEQDDPGSISWLLEIEEEEELDDDSVGERAIPIDQVKVETMDLDPEAIRKAKNGIRTEINGILPADQRLTPLAEFGFKTQSEPRVLLLLKSINNSYEVTRVIGRGAAGIVYEAKDQNGQKVAIKILDVYEENAKERMTQEGYVDKFLKEMDFTERLNHPHVVKYLERGKIKISLPSSDHEDRYRVFYVTELAEGSLESVIGAVPSHTVPQKNDFVEKTLLPLAKGLDYLATKGVIHRDLKPANILLLNGQPKITDFGLVKHVNEKTPERNIQGTISYMAPEQGLGRTSVDSDLFSFACICTEALLGEIPWMEKKDSSQKKINSDSQNGKKLLIKKALIAKNNDKQAETVEKKRLQKIFMDNHIGKNLTNLLLGLISINPTDRRRSLKDKSLSELIQQAIHGDRKMFGIQSHLIIPEGVSTQSSGNDSPARAETQILPNLHAVTKKVDKRRQETKASIQAIVNI